MSLKTAGREGRKNRGFGGLVSERLKNRSLDGGERGIRTLDTTLVAYTLSRRAPSTARTSLHTEDA